MGFIKTDPSQTKTVIALLIMLVAAIGVTVFRVSHKAPPPPVAQAASQAQDADRVQAAVIADVECGTSRNPFARPGFVSARHGAQFVVNTPAGRVPSANVSINPWKPEGIMIQHGKSAPVPHASQKTGSDEAKEPLPTYELLAIISGPKGSSAVIKSGQSQTQVVDAGDRVEGGFKVVSIGPERVVLSDGKVTLIAKRGMGSAQQEEPERVESVENDAQ